MLETLKDAMPPIITGAMYLRLFGDILPRHLYRDLILEFQKMMDQGKTCSLQEMVQKAVFYFENQVVNDIKTKQAHNIENKNLKRSQTTHNKSLNNAGAGQQTITCKFCNKPYHTADKCFNNPKFKSFDGKKPDYEGKFNAKSQDKCRNCGKIGHKVDGCRSGANCTTCGKGGHTAAVCMSKPCPHCGKHYPRSANHDYESCSGNAGSGAFLGNICREISNSADTTMNVDDQSVHSYDQYVDNDNMRVDPSVNAIQIAGKQGRSKEQRYADSGIGSDTDSDTEPAANFVQEIPSTAWKLEASLNQWE